MPKPRYKTNNWKQYNQALINRGRPRIFSDLVITTALIFSMPLRSSQGLWIPCFDLLNFHCAARTTVVSVVEPKTLM
ncbi:hypothetical protein BSR59_25095 [Vibrio parahaemolyticus]|nr:transposase [Vibrio parahaemolyticus]OOQ62405.1 hypothetical protein BSR59_25095 [Vibrio parahaemolyticus]OOQ72197.1 hypothetical protein BSR63_24550 [Vibrio parahaemolyticus]